MARFAGKVALVSGAAQGLGRAIAELLVEEGANVVLGDIDRERGTALASDLGPATCFTLIDVSREEDWQRAFQACRDNFGRVDVLVNNAGRFSVGTIETQTLEEWNGVAAACATGTFLGCKYGVAALSGDGGAIVNIASIASLQGMPYAVAYAAAKGAVESLTRSVAVHCAEMRYPIRCNSVHPGPIDTPMTAAISGQMESADLAGYRPTNRAYSSRIHRAEPQAIAEAVLFLASDAARWINGASLVVDGAASAMSAISGVPID